MNRKFGANNNDDWIEAYLRYVKNTEPRTSYKLWTAVSTIASVLQRKVFLNWGSEIWYPNFYIILTGPPAARKGTAMRPARRLLDSIGIRIAADEGSREKLIDSLHSSTKTIDGVGDIPMYHSALTINASELTVFLKSADNSMLSMLCKWFDCEDKYVYDVFKRGTQDIPGVWVNLLGATTPRLLQSALPIDAFGSGLISRTLFVYEDNKAKSIIYPNLDMRMTDDLTLDLEQMGLLRGQFKLAQPINGIDIIEEYGKWYLQCDANPIIKEQRLLDCNQRLQMHMWKLCMVLSASRSDDMIITISDFEKSKQMVTDLMRKMPRAFSGIGSNPLAAVQAQIITLMEQRKAMHISDLMNMFYNDVSEIELSQILGTLNMMHFITYDRKNNVIRLNEEER